MFDVGQKVYDAIRGEGVVSCVTEDRNYPVIVKLADGNSESYTPDGKCQKSHKNPSLYAYQVEIVKKIAKPSINWNHVRREYKFLAEDSDGNAWLYLEEPFLNGGEYWRSSSGEYIKANSYATYTPGTCDWKDSLVERP